jgi:hypothetical protein
MIPFPTKEFTAKIRKLGINPCVDVPEEIVNTLLHDANKKRTPVQVKVRVNGKGSFETSVVKYQGTYRLYFNTQMRREAGVDVNDTVRIELRYDPKPRMPPMLKALKEALNTNERAKEKWRLQTSSRRKEILMYLNSLRSEESIKRNVDKITRMLFELNTKRKN